MSILSAVRGINCLHAVYFFMLLWSSAAFFSKLLFFLKIFHERYIRILNGLGQDQDRHFVGPDLGPNCFQRLSADDENRR